MKIFYLPDLGEGLAEAEIREWYVKEGEVVTVDQPLVSMETAKAVVDVPSPYAGKIIKLHGQVNDIIKTGAPFITFETNEPVSDKDKGSVVGKLETSEKKWDESDVIIGTKKSTSATIKAMPAARVLAQHMQVDLQSITGTGPQGMITVDDVKQFLGQSKTHTASTVTLSKGEALHGVRRVRHKAMMQSHRDIVSVTIVDDADITDLPPKTDLTVLLLKAIVAAVKTEPTLNAWFDGKTLERQLFSEVNIGLAVDTPEGLFVPVIKHTENRDESSLRQLVDNYKAAVNARTISPTDMQGATITLSNFGTIAGRYATPIIIPPAVAILGCGRGREIVMPRNGEIVIGKMMPLSLSFDHRAATGGEATRFLGAIINYLQEYSV